MWSSIGMIKSTRGSSDMNTLRFVVALVATLFCINTAVADVKNDLVGKVCRARVSGLTMGALKMEFVEKGGKVLVTYRVITRDPQAYYGFERPEIDVRLRDPETHEVAVDNKGVVTFTSKAGSLYNVAFENDLKFKGGIDGRPAGLAGVARVEEGSCVASAPTAPKTAEKPE